MMVIFLVGLVSMILMRTLRKDYARYSKEEDGDDMVLFTVYLYILVIYTCVITCYLAFMWQPARRLFNITIVHFRALWFEHSWEYKML